MIKACDILRRCTEARRRRWRTDEQREQIEDYYNGGFIPNDDCGMDIQSLGLGNKQLRRPHKLLRSTIEHDGGPVEVLVSGLNDFNRTTDTKNAIEKAVGEWCRDNYRTLAAQVAGDFLITGRAFAWRSSKWDAKFRFGRPLHEGGASSDITDDSFWWWAFPLKLTLRDIDHFLETARGEKGKGGWQKDALRSLKDYVLRKPHGTEEVAVTPAMIEQPFGHGRADEPLHCYVYFEKEAKRSGVYRKINLRIVTRYTEKSGVQALEEEDQVMRRSIITKKLTLKVEDENKEEVIFAQDGAFDGILDCLIPWMEDARISGDQLLDEVEGDGKQFLPRLLVMEEMTDSATSGTAFAMRPHFTAGQDVPKRVMQRLQETGLPAFAVAPRGIGLLDKSNVINSSRAGLDIVQALGISIEEESSSNNMPASMGKRTQTEFAAEADMLRDSNQEGITLRFTFWHSGWDLLWSAVGRTFIRVQGWAKADPSYYEAKAVHEAYEEEGGKLADLKNGKFVFRSRRLPGGADRATAMQRFMLILNNPNAPAEYHQWAFNELIKLMFGNEAVAYFENRQKKPDASQIERAVMQTNAALASLLALPAERGDDPIVHLMQVHGPALMQQVELAGQKQYRDLNDNLRVQKLVEHMSYDLANLPGTSRQQAEMTIRQVIQQFQAIPEQAPINEMQMQQAKLQLEVARTRNEVQNGENLRALRGFQAQEKAKATEFNQLAQAKALGQQDRRIAVEEEKAQMAAAKDLLAPQTRKTA
jgi:hypothetical protein